MGIIGKIGEAFRCGLVTYICTKYDKQPIECVKEAKCEVPKAWVKTYKDEFEGTKKNNKKQ